MPAEPDYYQILQVDPSAEPEVITAAYRRLARKYHPDVSVDHAAAAKMTRLNAAYEILGNPEARRAYDAERLQRQTPSGAREAKAEPAARPRRQATHPRTKARQTRPEYRCLLCGTILDSPWQLTPTQGRPTSQQVGKVDSQRWGLYWFYVCTPCWPDWCKKSVYTQREILEENDPEVQSLPLKNCGRCGKEIRSRRWTTACAACREYASKNGLCDSCAIPWDSPSPGCFYSDEHRRRSTPEGRREWRREQRREATVNALIVIGAYTAVAVVLAVIVGAVILLR